MSVSVSLTAETKSDLSVVLSSLRFPIFCELESICVSSSLIAPTKLVLTSVVRLLITPILDFNSLTAPINESFSEVFKEFKSPI